MKRFRKAFLLVCLVPILAACQQAATMQPETTLLPTPIPPTETALPPTPIPTPTPIPLPPTLFGPEEIEELRTMFENLHETNTFSGSVLVAQNGEVVFSTGSGYSDRSNEIRNTPETRFRIASITKQMTATGILILAEQGKLGLQDDVCTYIPDCPDAWQDITIHHLLTHTSGIPAYGNLYGFRNIRGNRVAPEEIIDVFRDAPLMFEPGTDWRYSDSGYTLLGVVIAEASGMPFQEFMQDNIFRPLGMENTGFEDNGTLALGYDGKYADEPVVGEDPSVYFAAGDVYSTVEDMFLWYQAVSSGKLVSEELSQEMFTPHFAFPEDELDGYGYGWVIAKEYDRPLYQHPGGIEGYSGVIEWFPEDDFFIILLSNQSDEDNYLIGNLITSKVYED